MTRVNRKKFCLRDHRRSPENVVAGSGACLTCKRLREKEVARTGGAAQFRLLAAARAVCRCGHPLSRHETERINGQRRSVCYATNERHEFDCECIGTATGRRAP